MWYRGVDIVRKVRWPADHSGGVANPLTFCVMGLRRYGFDAGLTALSSVLFKNGELIVVVLDIPSVLGFYLSLLVAPII